MIRFIDKYRNRFLIEFICKTLKNNRAGGLGPTRSGDNLSRGTLPPTSRSPQPIYSYDQHSQLAPLRIFVHLIIHPPSTIRPPSLL